MKLPILASLSIAVPTLCRPDDASHGEACASGSSCDAARGDAMLQLHLQNSKVLKNVPQAYFNAGDGQCRIGGITDNGCGCWGKLKGYTDSEVQDICTADQYCMAWWKHDHEDHHQTFCLPDGNNLPAGGENGACVDTYKGIESTRRRVSRRRRTYTRRRTCRGSPTRASDWKGRTELDPEDNPEDTPCMIKTDCTCTDGLPAKVCDAPGEEKCSSCDDGFVLQDDKCERPCACTNGSPGVGCDDPQEQKCASCDDGYVLQGSVCELPTPLIANFHRRRLNSVESDRHQACREGCASYVGAKQITVNNEDFTIDHEGSKVCVSADGDWNEDIHVSCTVEPGYVQVRLETKTSTTQSAETAKLIMVAFNVSGEWTPLEEMTPGAPGDTTSLWYSLSGPPTQVMLSSVRGEMKNDDGWAFDWVKKDNITLGDRNGGDRCPNFGIDDHPTGSFSGCENYKVFDIPVP